MNRASKMAKSKRKETAFIRYLWPDATVDSAGSVRSWERRYDGGDRDWMRLACGAPVLLEHKWRQWPGGSRGMMAIVVGAYEQLEEAVETEAADGFLLAAYWPLHTSVEDVICYFCFHGLMVQMPAHQFKQHFIKGDCNE